MVAESAEEEEEGSIKQEMKILLLKTQTNLEIFKTG